MRTDRQKDTDRQSRLRVIIIILVHRIFVWSAFVRVTTSIPGRVMSPFQLCTLSYGKVKMVLKHNRYFVESRHSDVMQKLVKDPVVQSCMLSDQLGDPDVVQADRNGPAENKVGKIEIVNSVA